MIIRTGRPSGRRYPHGVTAAHELSADLAAELSQLVAQAAAGEVVYLTRNGRRVGALVAVETAEALQAAEDEAGRHAVAESLAEPGPDIPHEQVMARYTADPGNSIDLRRTPRVRSSLRTADIIADARGDR
jgi:prevent-host-death family protein